MGVLITDEPDETVFDIRLASARRSFGEYQDSLRDAYREASGLERDKIRDLIFESLRMGTGLAELISTRGK